MIVRRTFPSKSRDLRKRTARGRFTVAAISLLSCVFLLSGAGYAFARESLEDIADLPRVVPPPIVALPASQDRPTAEGGSAGRTAGIDEARYRAMVTGTRGMAPGAIVAGRLPELILGEPPAPLVKPVLAMPEQQKKYSLPELVLPGLPAEKLE